MKFATTCLVILSAALGGSCNGMPSVPVDRLLPIGTWGGDNAGAIVQDSLTHIHIGCTYGDIAGRVHLEDDGTFSVAGSYLLRAYPVAVGPTMPAQFTGTVDGKTLTFSVAVNDTVEHKTVQLGPATVELGKQPSMGPCPICSASIAARRLKMLSRTR